MKSASRRFFLMTVGAMPFVMLVDGGPILLRPSTSVSQAMRYLCEKVFPSRHDMRHREDWRGSQLSIEAGVGLKWL
jgi:hypothetical protein